MAIQTGKTLILTLGIALGVTACDQAGEPGSESADTLRTGAIENGTRLTLNTNTWIPASARDLHEFRDNGDPYESSYGHRATLATISLPNTPYGSVMSPAKGPKPPGQASIRLEPNDNFEFEVRGPNQGDPKHLMTGDDLVGLTLHFDMEDPQGNQYAVDLEIVDNGVDSFGHNLYEFDRVDPNTGNRVSLCEESEDYGRFARMRRGMHIEGDTGEISLTAPSIFHIGCMASVPGKAMGLGYVASPAEYDWFVLATRVVRADYCADNHPYTFPGNLFAVEDNLDGPMTMADVEATLDADQRIEAVWDENGVLCVGTPRAGNTLAEDIMCPTKTIGDTLVHNWQPPSCATFVDQIQPGDKRMYSITSVQ